MDIQTGLFLRGKVGASPIEGGDSREAPPTIPCASVVPRSSRSRSRARQYATSTSACAAESRAARKRPSTHRNCVTPNHRWQSPILYDVSGTVCDVTHYLVQHYFQDKSGLAEDRYTNVFHVNKEVGSLDAGGLLALLNNVINFYNTAPAGNNRSITGYMPQHAMGPNSRCAVYEFGVAPPNPPLLFLLYNPNDITPALDKEALPAEVAACVSYQGAPVTGIKLASVRGRVYLGPLNSDAADHTHTAKARPSSQFRSDCISSFKALNQGIPDDNPGTFLRQYSPTHSALHAITNWWMDDAWDTQRRRGGDPTSRVTGFP